MRFGALIPLVFLIVGAFNPAHADLACETARAEWYSHYVQDLGVSWDTTSFSCGSTDHKLAETFYDLEKTQFDRTSADVPKFYEIFKADVRKITTQKTSDGDCDGDTLAESIRGQDPKMLICPDFYTDDRVDRASTLAHESRHMEADDPGHVTCAKGPRRGKVGECDNKFTNGSRLGGGYNSDVNYLSAVVNSQIGNELSRSVAQSYINSYVPDVFNHITAEQIRAFRKN